MNRGYRWQVALFILALGAFAADGNAQTGGLPSEVVRSLEKLERFFLNKKVYVHISVSDIPSPQLSATMVQRAEQIRRQLEIAHDSRKPFQVPPSELRYHSRMVIYRNATMIKVEYSRKLRNFGRDSKDPRVIDDQVICYYAKGWEAYAPVVKSNVKRTDVISLIRYSGPAYYFLSPVNRDLQPPDFVFLAGINPLFMFWGDSDGWKVVQEDKKFLVVEKRGKAPCVSPNDLLRIRMWLDKRFDYLPYRIEKYNDDPRLPRNWRVAREIWQSKGVMQVGDTYLNRGYKYLYYVKGHYDQKGQFVYDGKVEKDYAITSVNSIGKNISIDFPSHLYVMDYSLDGENPIIGSLSRGVPYEWSKYKRFLETAELQKLLEDRQPQVQRPRLFMTAIVYLPPLILIVLGLTWLWRQRRSNRQPSRL